MLDEMCQSCGATIARGEAAYARAGRVECRTCYLRAGGKLAPVAPPEAPIACDNCGRSPGRLERLTAWRGHRVCADCLERIAPAPGAGEVTKGVTVILVGLLMLAGAVPAALAMATRGAASAAEGTLIVAACISLVALGFRHFRRRARPSKSR